MSEKIKLVLTLPVFVVSTLTMPLMVKFVVWLFALPALPPAAVFCSLELGAFIGVTMTVILWIFDL